MINESVGFGKGVRGKLRFLSGQGTIDGMLERLEFVTIYPLSPCRPGRATLECCETSRSLESHKAKQFLLLTLNVNCGRSNFMSNGGTIKPCRVPPP